VSFSIIFFYKLAMFSFTVIIIDVTYANGLRL